MTSVMNPSKSMPWLRPASSGPAPLQDKSSYYQNLQHKNSTQNIHSILKIEKLSHRADNVALSRE